MSQIGIIAPPQCSVHSRTIHHISEKRKQAITILQIFPSRSLSLSAGAHTVPEQVIVEEAEEAARLKFEREPRAVTGGGFGGGEREGERESKREDERERGRDGGMERGRGREAV